MPRTNRWSRLFLLPLLLGALAFGAACSGGDDDDDDDDSDSSDSSSDSNKDSKKDSKSDKDATPTAKSGSGNGGSSFGASQSDLDKVAGDLEPPNAKQVMRFAADDGISVSWESDKSVKDLKTFYDDRLDKLKINVQGELTLGESYNWIIGNSNGKGIQGTVYVAPSGTAGKSAVSITLAPGD